MSRQAETDVPAEPTTNRFSALGPLLEQALLHKGYSTLTPVQEQVLDPGLTARDLRISSQTGSGKTLAIGFVLRDLVLAHRAGKPGKPRTAATPTAIVVVPTRELARQVQLELGWLYGKTPAKVASVAGGASYRDEHRTLATNPAIVVGTPGRLLDHLKQGAIDTQNVGVVVLDEADQMLDLGFKDELDAIFEHMPEERLTHLVSATFPREVRSLADRVQQDPVHIEGTPLGSANTDIDHIVHLIDPRERIAALVNVLLHAPDDQTLVFARTRADVAEISRELQSAGFAAGALSGEMAQASRNQALDAFKRGRLRALVATDVAARGIDVQNIARVVQIDAPANADTYTHRSGRTGRAGRKGVSVLLIPRSALARTERTLSQANVKFRVQPVPSAESIRRAQDDAFIAELCDPAAGQPAAPQSDRIRALVERIREAAQLETALARLLSRLERAQGEPRHVTPVAPPSRAAGFAKAGAVRGEPRRPPNERQWELFHVTWGQVYGADARRMVAMLCRRGGIQSRDIGAVRIAARVSEVEIAKEVAAKFAQAVREPDPRDPRVKISPFRPAASGGGARPKRAHRADGQRPRRAAAKRRR
jgi:ATP-dependent RNA helicase DeaD